MLALKVLGFAAVAAASCCNFGRPDENDGDDAWLDDVPVNPVQHEPFTGEWFKEGKKKAEDCGVRSGHPCTCEDRNGGCPFDIEAFSCPVPGESTDPRAGQDIYHLRPSDVSVVMAIGDSITAGFAMDSKSLPLIPHEFRGRVFDAGADSSSPSLFQFFRRYNDKLIGGCKGTTRILAKGKDLNQAITGSRAPELVSQVNSLVKVLSGFRYGSVRDDWKLLTVLIGANDLCGACKDRSGAADRYEAGVREALTKARQNLKNTFVNLLGMFRFSDLYKTKQHGYCKFVDRLMKICGNCDMHDSSTREFMDSTIREFNRRLEKLAGEFGNKDDNFTVVYQPGLTDFRIGDHGRRILSNFDCFHPNECANRGMSAVLWNNMFTPTGKKATTIEAGRAKLVCPGENTFLQ